MRHFYSGLMPFTEPKPKGFPFRGKGFRYRLVKCDAYGEEAKLKKILRRKRLPRFTHPIEIIIDAQSEQAARRAHDLIWGAFAVVQGGNFHMVLHDIEKSMFEDRVLKDNPAPVGRSRVKTNGITEAAELAAKASFKRAAVYAIAKYHFSVSLCSVHLVDLDPQFATETFQKMTRPIHQVQAATAIVQAYGVLEELGLDVRASNRTPSSIDGVWNPVVKEDLERRLVKAGVDITDLINWQIRGNKTKLETEKPRQIHQTSKPSPWARWTIRDRMVDIVDAIAHLSWLRSHVSSHRMNTSRANLLSLYDVTNCQFLARQLILESTGLWKKWIERDAGIDD